MMSEHKPNKDFGQNFLNSPGLAKLMIDELDIEPADNIIEIGPGRGFLTRPLIEKRQEIRFGFNAVDLDKVLVKELKEEYPNENIINVNVLDFLPRVGEETKLIGSLPYNITSPIFHSTIKMRILPKICVFLIQYEVAQKILDTPPKANYLANFIQTFYEVKAIKKVKKGLFYPVPKVDGQIIKLQKKNPQVIQAEEIEKYEEFLHKFFSHPRKMLNKAFDENEIKIMGINPTLRAQNFSAEQTVNAFRMLNKNKPA